MGKKEKNVPFVCVLCHRDVMPLQNGSYRNHCPYCLTSRHIDEEPGDRKSLCGGVMDAQGLVYHGKKGWQIIHKCQRCGVLKVNKIAERDPQPDDWDALLRLRPQSRGE